MADLAQQFGENTIDEPISETILRDLRLVSVPVFKSSTPGVCLVRTF